MSVSDLGAAVNQLRATPEMLRLMAGALTPDDFRWKPQPSRYSIAEVLAHMAHADEHCFGLRMTRVLGESEPKLDPYDDASFLAAAPEHLSDGAARLGDFAATRARWMDAVTKVDAAGAARKGMHPQMGAVTCGELLTTWAFHDLGHIRQIAELIRAHKFFGGLGPFQSLYTVRP